jgi:hypothetical protein
MWRVAESMAQLGAPWADVEEAYLKAWEFRPTRAEPLHDIARRYREDQRYALGHLFAARAAAIPYPEQDTLFVRAEVYAWRAIDEQAVCASWIDKQAEAFTLCRRLLACPEVPDDERQRITGNRDVCVPTMIEAAAGYPEAVVQSLPTSPTQADVVVTLVAGPDLASTEHTLNSFVNCCTDVARVGHFLILDAGLSARDRALLGERYRFLEFIAAGPGEHLACLREHIEAPFWLHLGQGWQFFAPENYITRLTAILDTQPQVFQVGINFTDAVKLTATSAAETDVQRAPDTGRYLLTDQTARGPAMFHTTRLDQAGAGLRTATLDEVLCITAT